jgi:hypothetical protein
MRNPVRLLIVSLFIIAVYFLIAVLIKYYVDLVINWNLIWIILVTILTLVIPRIIFNSIPLLLIKVSRNATAIKLIYNIISVIAILGYLYFIFMLLDTKEGTNAKACIISALMFIAYSNFFKHGIFIYTNLCDKITDEENEIA